MKVTLGKSEVRGKVTAPPSKSYTIRGLMCAALARGESEIVHPLVSDDTLAAAEVLGKIGVGIRKETDLWRVSGGNFRPAESDLFCADSAATLRFMTAICAAVPGYSRLTVGSSLAQRPIRPLVRALQKMGVDCSCEGDYAPVEVNGGRLKGGVTDIAGNISSQFISALLLIAPLTEKGLKIRLTKPLESRSYIMMTLLCLRRFGVNVSRVLDKFVASCQSYQPTSYSIEGDWSSASYFLALGAAAGEVSTENLNSASWQGDRVMLDFLREMGARIEINGNTVTVRKAPLKAISADLSDCIDLLPTMAVLAAMAEGQSIFNGIERARLKESNRVTAVRDGLTKMGITVLEDNNRMTITGGAPKSAEINSFGDHRIAMAFSIPGIIAGDTVINGAECVTKTYPQYWDDLGSIGGKVAKDDK
ncbi:MAG: 3-phosphoshikimate 1-carboxyvinyltransferase [Dehalococcoidales bacterium]|nr:3-phosphoshikimate 1-carboxyvinyltransferase [Dehalococcoidales bacterium]